MSRIVKIMGEDRLDLSSTRKHADHAFLFLEAKNSDPIVWFSGHIVLYSVSFVFEVLL